MTLIPFYLYENQKVLYCFPEQNPITHPPIQYVNQLKNKNSRVSHITTSSFSYFGGIPVKSKKKLLIVLGPISQVNYTKDTLRIMRKEYVLNSEHEEEFVSFFNSIPSFQFQHFIHVLISSHFFINQEEINFYQYLKHELYEHSNINPSPIEITDENAKDTQNNSYYFEEQLLKYVEEGNKEGIQRAVEKPFIINEGSIASNNIRQVKNIAIVTITLTTRAAIRGGLSPKEAFQLSDEYIKQIENMASLNSIINLYQESILHFTEKVMELKFNIGNIPELKHIVIFIQQNTNLPLSVNFLTEKFNYSRTYLSARFKSKVGISLSQFILQTKLQEGKHLLISTDKSISEISTYLCFSSQSHFQNAFKKYYSISPGKYRRENKNFQY
jgi:AraC-like DNA-binding protein